MNVMTHGNFRRTVRQRSWRAPGPARPATVGLLLLIPALAAIGPLGAALLIRHHNAGIGPGTAALTTLLAATAVLVAIAVVALTMAWHHASVRHRLRHDRHAR
ncbi:hypothetical protein [Nocardia spumae]|uniref:hypothetical protein n=1 Tax=Nocardia spumae TaxID=2887190 RepID=UPI001D156896|nr:hypothetical protein [Nocardia spumae]